MCGCPGRSPGRCALGRACVRRPPRPLASEGSLVDAVARLAGFADLRRSGGADGGRRDPAAGSASSVRLRWALLGTECSWRRLQLEAASADVEAGLQLDALARLAGVACLCRSSAAGSPRGRCAPGGCCSLGGFRPVFKAARGWGWSPGWRASRAFAAGAVRTAARRMVPLEAFSSTVVLAAVRWTRRSILVRVLLGPSYGRGCLGVACCPGARCVDCASDGRGPVCDDGRRMPASRPCGRRQAPATCPRGSSAGLLPSTALGHTSCAHKKIRPDSNLRPPASKPAA